MDDEYKNTAYPCLWKDSKRRANLSGLRRIELPSEPMGSVGTLLSRKPASRDPRHVRIQNAKQFMLDNHSETTACAARIYDLAETTLYIAEYGME